MKTKRAPDPEIILASSSPRRIEMLEKAGLRFRSMSPDADETVRRGEAPRALVARLAETKARAAVAAVKPTAAGRRTLIIAADTIVVSPDGKKILGKPRDRAEACRMLGELLGRRHDVLTGYCVLEVQAARVTRKRVRVVRSRVRMRKVGPAEIRRYVDSGEPMDKAGSYGAQGIGMGLIESLSGSYSNVVGLPMAQLLSDLENLFGLEFLGSRP